LCRSQVDAFIAAASDNSICFDRLQTAVDASVRELCMRTAIEGLGITTPGDKLAFMVALDALWQQAADADGA
jgi:hypothetical protein